MVVSLDSFYTEESKYSNLVFICAIGIVLFKKNEINITLSTQIGPKKMLLYRFLNVTFRLRMDLNFVKLL